MLQSDEYSLDDAEDEDDEDGLLEYEELEVEPADFTVSGLNGGYVLVYHSLLQRKSYTASRSSTAHHNLEMFQRSECVLSFGRLELRAVNSNAPVSRSKLILRGLKNQSQSFPGDDSTRSPRCIRNAMLRQ